VPRYEVWCMITRLICCSKLESYWSYKEYRLWKNQTTQLSPVMIMNHLWLKKLNLSHHLKLHKTSKSHSIRRVDNCLNCGTPYWWEFPLTHFNRIVIFWKHRTSYKQLKFHVTKFRFVISLVTAFDTYTYIILIPHKRSFVVKWVGPIPLSVLLPQILITWQALCITELQLWNWVLIHITSIVRA